MKDNESFLERVREKPFFQKRFSRITPDPLHHISICSRECLPLAMGMMISAAVMATSSR